MIFRLKRCLSYLDRTYGFFIENMINLMKINYLLRIYHFVDRNISFLNPFPPPPRQELHQNPAHGEYYCQVRGHTSKSDAVREQSQRENQNTRTQVLHVRIPYPRANEPVAIPPG